MERYDGLIEVLNLTLEKMSEGKEKNNCEIMIKVLEISNKLEQIHLNASNVQYDQNQSSELLSMLDAIDSYLKRVDNAIE